MRALMFLSYEWVQPTPPDSPSKIPVSHKLPSVMYDCLCLCIYGLLRNPWARLARDR